MKPLKYDRIVWQQRSKDNVNQLNLIGKVLWLARLTRNRRMSARRHFEPRQRFPLFTRASNSIRSTCWFQELIRS